MLKGNVLITGGTGTLGKAIVHRALKEKWECSLTIYSRSELAQAQMRARYPQCRYIIGDVRDETRLAAAIAGHEIVIHAAAAKRIPEAEEQPYECYRTNVEGSQNVIRACIQNGVRRCVAISTDKACRAVTAYGASKLMMEKEFQAAPDGVTTFTLVRYGNVVASRGSVIPLWQQQAAEGKPLTITDKRCTRFWMGPGDAVDLILIALGADRGTIVVPRMKALNIFELAQAIAPGAAIQETGLRSCEKLHEDLIHFDENSMPHPTRPDIFFVGHNANWGSLGYSYKSDIAPKLYPKEFMEMLAEAENYE